MGQELGRVQHHHFQRDQRGLSPHPYPQPQPLFHLHPHPPPYYSAQFHDWHEAMQREIEKEGIRQEIIMSEILRRRALEAEVVRELMMERETALQRGVNGFPFGSPSPLGLDLPMRLPLAETRAEERVLDERSMSLTQRHILNNTCEGGRSESLPFQRASNDVRTVRDTEVKPVSEGSNGKKKIVLLAKPIENITGAKTARSGSVTSEPQSDGNLKKKKKVNEEWSCALCQVIAPSEHALNEHLWGTKHKKKEAALQAQHAGKNSRIGLCTKTVAKPIQGLGTSNPITEVKLTPEPLPFGKRGDASSATDGLWPLQGNSNPDDLKKDESVVTPEVQKNDKPKKETVKFWCEICEVGPPTEKAMKVHQQGKKHKRQLQNRAVEKTHKRGDASSATDGPWPLQGNSNPDILKKDESVVTPEVQKNDKPKKETVKFWCEICEVGPPTEKAMKVHQQGKKHKRQLQNRAVEKTHKRGDASSATDGPWPLQGNSNPDNLKKDESVVTPEVQKNDKPKKETVKFWCEICEVGLPTENAMKVHQQGKKHKRQLQNRAVEKTRKFWCEMCQVGSATEKAMKMHQ